MSQTAAEREEHLRQHVRSENQRGDRRMQWMWEDADEQDLAHRFVFEFTQRHPMLLEEANEVLTGNPAVLRTWDAISSQAA